MSILTDTTERSPTFSLAPFKNHYSPHDKESWCNLVISHSEPSQEGLNWEEKVERDWTNMLERKIRGLNSPFWSKYHNKVTNAAILGFGLHEERKNTFSITHHPLTFELRITGQPTVKAEFPSFSSECRLSQHSILKVLLNSLSTLVMGRLGRYYSNIMTYVKPTNYKLIDRAARYVLILRPQTSYEEAVRAIYDLKNDLGPDEPIVLKVIERLNTPK